MSKFKDLVKSMRLRTLPLSLAGVCLGILLAWADYFVDALTAVLIVLTTVLLQILSNLSNELGDVLHGTDTEERQGPSYGLNGGSLSINDMRIAIRSVVVLCCLSGLFMVLRSFGTLMSIEPICLLLLGALAIIGALRYTLGRNPYGYRGLGDLYVFVFFGLVSVLGAFFVSAHTIPAWFYVLPAASIGCFSMAVLNVNNIRDMKTDAANRVTVAIKLGERGARIYHTVLIVLGWLFMIAFCQFRMFSWSHYAFVLTLPLYVLHLRGVWTLKDRALDKMLPLLVMSTFVFSLLTGVGFIL